MLASFFCGEFLHTSHAGFIFFPRSSAASGRTTVLWIISFVLKRLLEMPSFKKKNTSYPFSLTLKKLTTQRGSTTFWRTSGISVSGATSPGLFRASCRNVLSGLEWVPLFPSCTSRRWRSRKVASCLRPFSALKLTTLLKLSERVLIAPCLWTTLLCVWVERR